MFKNHFLFKNNSIINNENNQSINPLTILSNNNKIHLFPQIQCESFDIKNLNLIHVFEINLSHIFYECSNIIFKQSLFKKNTYLFIRYQLPSINNITTTPLIPLINNNKNGIKLQFSFEHYLKNQEDISNYLKQIHGTIIFEFYLTSNNYFCDNNDNIIYIANAVLSYEELIKHYMKIKRLLLKYI